MSDSDWVTVPDDGDWKTVGQDDERKWADGELARARPGSPLIEHAMRQQEPNPWTRANPTLNPLEAIARIGRFANQGLQQSADLMAEHGGIPGAIAGTVVGTAGEALMPKDKLGAAMAILPSALNSPPARALGGGIAKALEGGSGLEYKTPGALGEVFNDPKILLEGLLGKGKRAAGALYEAATTPRANSLEDVSTHAKLIDDAIAKFDEGRGLLTAEEGLAARKSLDRIMKAVPDSFYHKYRSIFDFFAKTKFAGADAAYARGVTADAVSSFIGPNKQGGTSVAKIFGSLVTGGAGLPLVSPLIQAAGAAALGTVAAIPGSPMVAYNSYREWLKRRQNP